MHITYLKLVEVYDSIFLIRKKICSFEIILVISSQISSKPDQKNLEKFENINVENIIALNIENCATASKLKSQYDLV